MTASERPDALLPAKLTPREVMRDVLGVRCADAIIRDMGAEWATFVTTCAILERGPTNDRERAFMKWADRVTQPEATND